jgi:glycosyltransferase involved in cell wall biosynthesis
MNRPASLDLTLASLKAQSCQPFEIVIADDSDQKHARSVMELAEKWGCRYLEGPRRGLYANRNHSLLSCAGSHVRTMDDDHRLPTGHLEACLKAVESDPNSIWTVGESGFIDGIYIGTLPTASQLHASGLGTAVTNLDDNWAIADGSTIYPCQVFQSGYRMVERFNFGSSYLEFGAYLYSRGFKSRCVRGTVVEHYTQRQTIDRMKELGVIESQLFSSLCFNLYFRPNSFLAFKYIAACIAEAKLDPGILKGLPKIVRTVQERWEKR